MNDCADQEIFVFFGVKDIMRLLAVTPETSAQLVSCTPNAREIREKLECVL
jgi:hypothetical protein